MCVCVCVLYTQVSLHHKYSVLLVRSRCWIHMDNSQLVVEEKQICIDQKCFFTSVPGMTCMCVHCAVFFITPGLVWFSSLSAYSSDSSSFYED